MIELCDDLLTRLVDYGLVDKENSTALQIKLVAAWTVFKKEKIKPKPVINFLDEFVNQILHVTEIVGIIGYAEHEAQHRIVAFCLGNMTGVAVTMVGTVMAKMAISKLSEL